VCWKPSPSTVPRYNTHKTIDKVAMTPQTGNGKISPYLEKEKWIQTKSMQRKSEALHNLKGKK